jgi:hypothetical protein
VLSISGGDPAFRGDDGAADPALVIALADFSSGQGSEHAVLTALAASRMLVPVVAVLAGEADAGEQGWVGEQGRADAQVQAAIPPAGCPQGAEPEPAEALRRAVAGEKATDMAMPTLVGADGRSAIPAFTCLESLTRWQAGARPVPVPALGVWQTAYGQSAAVVIDVAGPVPFAVEGSRLAALARGEDPPFPHADPDVRQVIAEVLADHPEVASFDLENGSGGANAAAEHDLAIVLALTGDATVTLGGAELAELGGSIVVEVMSRLAGRLRRGVGIWLAEPEPIERP